MQTCAAEVEAALGSVPEEATDFADLRNRLEERERIASLLELLPQGDRVLEIGARDGYVSLALAERFNSVIALDLVKLEISHPRIQTIKGDVRALEFASRSFDAVLCAEVLEHIPSAELETACRELCRVAGNILVIGVPYRQDLRVGSSTCQNCGKINPPWGHLNSFDERKLDRLFTGLVRVKTSWVGRTSDATNVISARLMDLAGNPWGTYDQEEPCVQCGKALGNPPPWNLRRRILSASAARLNKLQQLVTLSRPNWIHCAYRASVR